MAGALALVAAGLAATVPAMAQSPGWAGPDVSKKSEENKARQNQKDGGAPELQPGMRRDEQKGASRDAPKSERRSEFEDRHRVAVRSYYEENYRGNNCPPGLLKKNNGCMPPGQARQWHYGQPLPRDAVYYEVPQPLVMQLGAPRPGYRYVRVATDILLIAIATNMVVDAIEDLGRN
jgi:Ni/Co efflux regulator RcnB